VRGMALGVALLLSRRAEASSRPLAGDALDLDWLAPPECPARDAVLGQIRRVLGEAPPRVVREEPPLAVQVSVFRRDAGRWHVRMVVAGESGGERSLDASSCSAVASAAALVLAIRIRPTLFVGRGSASPPSLAAGQGPAPPPPPPLPLPPEPLPALPQDSEPGVIAAPAPSAPPSVAPPPPVEIRIPIHHVPSESEREVHEASPPAAAKPSDSSFLVGATGDLGLGELPSVAPGAEVTVTYVWKVVRVEAHGETGLVQSILVSGGTNAASTVLRAAGGGLRGCYNPQIRAVGLLACADAELDGMWGTGDGFPKTLPTTEGTWLTFGALIGGRYRLSDVFALRASAEALAPARLARFVTLGANGQENGTVYGVSAVWGRFALGVEARFY
jgi:hypothetical protein